MSCNIFSQKRFLFFLPLCIFCLVATFVVPFFVCASPAALADTDSSLVSSFSRSASSADTTVPVAVPTDGSFSLYGVDFFSGVTHYSIVSLPPIGCNFTFAPPGSTSGSYYGTLNLRVLVLYYFRNKVPFTAYSLFPANSTTQGLGLVSTAVIPANSQLYTVSITSYGFSSAGSPLPYIFRPTDARPTVLFFGNPAMSLNFSLSYSFNPLGTSFPEYTTLQGVTTVDVTHSTPLVKQSSEMVLNFITADYYPTLTPCPPVYFFFPIGVYTDSTSYRSLTAFGSYLYSLPRPSLDANENYNAGYDQGFSAGESFGYSQGESAGYNSGFSAGEHQGYNSGYNAGIESANTYSFLGLLGAVVDAPIKALTGLLDFEIFGFDMAAFALSLLTAAILLKLVSVIL